VQSFSCAAFSGRVVPALHYNKEGRMARSSRESAVKPRPASGGVANGKTARNGKSLADARKDLLERAGRNRDGASHWRSDPLADAKAARRVADLAQAHAPELSRRGLSAAYTEAARRLADEIEDHLQALPAAAVTARGRSREEADLLADAAATAHTAREALQRVTRGADGRRAAHAFGIGQPFSARQAQHVLRALRLILEAAKAHPEVASDAGLIPEDLQTMRDLAADVEKLPGAGAPLTDEAQALVEAQGALRAYFDLLAAKATLAFAGDPEERARLLSLLPRADDRRHLRRSAAEEIPAA
jgi:hypothetical protein